jgi:cell filamentation protein
MSRYQISTGVEGEAEPGSRGLVLRNRLGIVRKGEMDQAEASALLRAQTRYLSVITDRTCFAAKLLCKMHREWLGSIYVWAGRYRSVEVSKGGFTWPPAYRIAENMETFESNLLRSLTPCREEDVEVWALAAAKVHAEFLLVHPFREGNGRLARWLTDLMAHQSGYPALDYAFSGKAGRTKGKNYLDAVVAGYARNYEPLAGFLAEALRRGGLRAGGGSFTPRAPSK